MRSHPCPPLMVESLLNRPLKAHCVVCKMSHLTTPRSFLSQLFTINCQRQNSCCDLTDRGVATWHVCMFEPMESTTSAAERPRPSCSICPDPPVNANPTVPPCLPGVLIIICNVHFHSTTTESCHTQHSAALTFSSVAEILFSLSNSFQSHPL